jgi:hypothetical protein
MLIWGPDPTLIDTILTHAIFGRLRWPWGAALPGSPKPVLTRICKGMRPAKFPASLELHFIGGLAANPGRASLSVQYRGQALHS